MMKLSLVKLDDNEKNAAGGNKCHLFLNNVTMTFDDSISDVVLKAKDVKKGDTYDGTFGPNEE